VVALPSLWRCGWLAGADGRHSTSLAAAGPCAAACRLIGDGRWYSIRPCAWLRQRPHVKTAAVDDAGAASVSALPKGPLEKGVMDLPPSHSRGMLGPVIGAGRWSWRVRLPACAA